MSVATQSSEKEEFRTERVESVVSQMSPGKQEITVSRTESVVVSKVPSKATSTAASVHTSEPMEVKPVHTLNGDLVLTPTTVSTLGKSPTKTPTAEPTGGYRHMVAESIFEAAKRAEAYLHGHDVHSSTEALVKPASKPESKVSTQPASKPQSKTSTQPPTRRPSTVDNSSGEESTNSKSDTQDNGRQDAAVLILSASGKNSRQTSGAEHRRASATPSNYSLMVPVKEESPFTESENDTSADFSGFESQDSPGMEMGMPMPREMDMSTPMPQATRMPQMHSAKSPAKTPQRVDEHVPGYREMVAGTIVGAAMRAEAYLHGHMLRHVEPVPATSSQHSSRPVSMPSTQPQTRRESRTQSSGMTSPSKAVSEHEIVPLTSGQTSFSPPRETSPMKSATLSPPRRPSSVVSAISMALSRANQSNPSYERLPGRTAESEDGNTTDAKENENHESNSWKTVSSKSLKPIKPLSSGASKNPSKKSSFDRRKSRTSTTEVPTPATATRAPTREPTPTPKSSVEQFTRNLRERDSVTASGEVTPTPERLHVRPVLGEAVNSTTSAVSQLLDTSKLRNKDKHHRTVHWLKELLSSQGSSTPTQLTALPPRTHRGSRESRGSVHVPMSPPEPNDITAIREDLEKSHEDNGEAFNKTIEDLESLLSEALQIARNAAEKDEGHVRRFSDSVQSVDYGGHAEGRSYGLSGARPRLRSVVSVPHDLVSIHESGGSSSSSSFVSHPSDVYPEQYHSAVRATSGATHGIVVQNVVVDEAPTWRRLPAPVQPGSGRRGSMAATRDGMPKDRKSVV